MSKKSISVSEYNKLRSNENATSSRSMTKSDYDNLRSNKGTAVPLSVNGKDYGKISANAYNAIRYNNLDVYTPTNDAEKSIIDSYIKDNFKDNKGNTLATSLDDYKKKVEQAQTQAEEKTGFGKWLGSQALAGLATFNKGVAATLDFILPTEFLGKYDYISKMNDYYSNQHDLYQQAAAKTSVSRGKGWETAGDVISGTVAALPNAILAFMSGGTSLGASGGATLATGASSASSTAAMVGQAVKTMAKNPMYWTSALQTLGTDYEEAKERGANDFVAASTAIITTALNAGIEVGGGIETLPKNLKTGGKNAVFEWVKSSLDEGKEEVLQGITTNAMAKLMYDKNAPLVSLTDDNAVLNPIKSAQEFAMGAAVGGILGGGQIATQSAVNTVSYTRTGKFFKDPDAVQAIIDTGLESPKDSRSYKLAVKANSKKGNLSNYEIGRLYYANVEQIVNEESNNAEDVTNETNTTIEASETDLNSDVNNNVGTVNTTVQVSSPEAASTTAETEQSNKTDEQTQSKVKAPVVVGDTFYDTKTGTTLTVVNRDENNTVVRVNESGIEKTYTNDVADMITSNPAFEKVDSTSTPETTAATNSETALPDANTAQDNQSNQSAETVTMTDGTIVRRVGDFYEAYGSEAEALAQKLDLTVTSKVVDGVKTPMVGFPVNLLDTYNSRLNAVTSINEQNVPVTDENTLTNENITDTDIINHTKEFEGMKLIDIQESAVYGGKTLLTGVYELNIDKDFNRKSYKKENFDILLQSEPWIKSVSGTTYGHYAFTKTKAKNYSIAYLPAGQGIAKVDSENKARAAIKVLDERKPELPLSVQAYGDDGVKCVGITKEIVSEINEIINSATENADEITLPLKSKKDLITYLKQHKGSKIGVSYNNGAEDIRTIVSASDTAIVTERADGQQGRLSAKSSELSYTEDGFVFTGSNGVKVAYRFIMEDGVTKAPETVIETPESVTKSEKTEENAPASEKNGAMPYTDREKANWENSNSIIVYENEEQFDAFIKEVLNNENTNKKIYFGKIPDATAQMVLDKTGVDVFGHNIALKGYEIRKILLHSHGDKATEVLRGQEPITADDLKNIPSVITDPDNVSLSDKEYEGKPALLFEKNIDGKNYVVAYVSRKHKDIAIQTMYKKRSLATAENADALSSTPETTSSTASIDSISQEAENVNTSEEIVDTPTLTDKCEMYEMTHTKTGEALWVISLNDKISSDEYKALSAAVKKVGGYYSRFAKTPDGKAIPGFIFKSEPDADVINTFNSFFGTETTEETIPAETKSGAKEIDTEALLGAVENAKVGDEIKLADHEKAETGEQGLNNEPENDTMVSEKVKEDFKVGDIISVNGKQWRVTSTDFTMTFENLDKNDSEATFQHIGGMDSFKDTHDYTVIKESAENVHDGILGRKGENDNSVRKSEPVSEAKEKRQIGTADRELGENVADESGTGVQAPETDTSSTGQLDSGNRNDRVRESDDGTRDSGTGIVGNDNVDVETSESSTKKSKDFVITKAVAENIDTANPSMDDNIKAIETLHDIEASGKAPTKAQQGILAKFKGWGGLAGSFYGANKTKLQEFMSDDEIRAAQSTVNDAYFTPTTIIDSIYKALNHIGFEGGNVLEPSMGVGNFFGRMPKAVKDNSNLFGVEIDSISGRIAQQLYPSANIEIAPFQDVAYKDGAFDLIIGNVPFGEVKYKYKNKKYLIHDYFFVKAMDKLNDGGILAFLTTKGTLDKLDSTTRAELANQGKLIGAYRLPSNVFSKSAGANVVTDLIIMQKSTDKDGESFVNLSSVPVGVDTFSINEYFANHPENIIGELTTRKDWRSGKTELDVRATGNTAEQLVKAIKKLPKNLISGVQTVGTVNVTENTARMQTFTVTEKDVVEYVDVSTGEVKQIKGKNAITAKEYIKLKEAYQDLVDTTLSGNSTEVIESKRKALNTVYDGFVKKHGTLEKNKKLLSVDNDFYKMSGLEVYDTKTKKTVKSEMFTKDTLGKRKPKKADSVLDALSISIGETGTVDLNRIAGLTGLTEDEAAEQLLDRIVYTPDGEYELNEVYLSGNVREKYEAVKGKKGFEKNAQMLEAIIPEDITAKNITPQFGSPWIKPDYVADFLTELLNLRYKPTVNYDPTTGTWSVSGNTWGDHTLLTKKYGTAYMDAMSIAEKALNMRRIVVTDKDKKILVGETRAAQQKAEDIKAAFEEWCFKDADRRKDLVKTFNEKFNSNRNMDFSELAKYLTFDGLSDTFKLRDYQKRAVARAVFNGNTLLAHGVGTGKTAEMIAIAMELKRMGIAKKNMMVVPNHKVADFRNDILKMYPSAKVAAIKTGANPTERQRFYALVASNDFDIVIIPHSSFGMLDVSAETKRAFINNQIYELEEVLTAAQEEKGKIDGRFIRTLENQKKRLEEKLKFVTESAKDSGNTFEELGVDSLFVDEAHNFKNLPFYSKLSRVAGVSVKQSNNKTRASRAENMFMITDYLNRNDGRIVFGTATPITNSMSEIYNMTRFLRPDILEEAGIQSFDAWASMFGSIVNQAEVDPSGRNMRMKERFSKFKNVSQMVEQFRRMADILKTGDVIQELPKAERINVTNKPNDIQEEFLDIIDDMIDEVRSKGQRAEHNMLEITKAGQMAAIDLRFVKSYFNGKYTDDDLNLPNNRTSQVAQKVYKEYVESNATKGTQFVFCDEGVYDDPNKKYNFYVYGDLINKLVNLGIPREEIAIAQEFEDKADLSAKVNTGEIRVLIGSTAVMGEGMNAQQKAVALHHMTVPYRPSDIEQREGRIIRFGNENKNVRIYRYIQEGSYDSYQWQMQERKANFINQALSGGTVEELEEMSDFQLSAREAKAIASGNPLLLEKIEIEDKLNKLKSIRSKFNTDKLEMQDRLATLPKRIAQKEKAVSTTAADVKTIKGNATEDFEITLGKTKYTERAKAAEALKKGLVKAPRNGSMLKIGAYRGLDLYYTSSFDKGTHYVLKGEGEYSVLGGESASGNITRIINLAEKIGETIETDKQMLENYKTEIETLKKEIDSEFPQTKELEDLQAKLNEIDTQLGINVDTVDMSEVIVADEVEDDVQSSRDLASGNSAERWTTERVDGNEGKGVNLADIVRSISKKFDIPIATGKVTDSEASGAYKRKAETIRTRIANNLPTISHELGHHLDKDYDFSNMESVELLKSSVSKEFLEQYEEADRGREAVAEFVRVYLKNTNDANRLCPEFYTDFISTLSKEDLKSLNEIAASVNEYLSYNISERYDAAITTSKKQEKLSFKEKWQRLYTSWVDAFHPQKEAVDYVEEVTGRTLSGKGNAYVLATNSLNAHTIANYLICEGFRDLDGNVVDAKSFVDSIGMVDSKNVSLLDKYLVLRHSLEWIAPTESDVAPKRVFADDTLENVEEIEKQIAQIEAEHPEIKTAAENLYEYQNNVLRHFVIPAGGMSEETLDMLNRKYPSYVPFYRAVGKKSGMAKGTFVNQRSPIMRAKGSGALILSPVESIIRNTEKMVKLALRNQTARVLSSYADTVDGFGQFMEAIPPDMIPHSVNIVKSKETFTDALQQIVSSGEDYFAVSDLFEQIFGNEVTDFTPVANANKRIVTVLQDGRPTYYQIHDEALYNAVAELAPQQANGYVKWATKIMQPMKLLITQNNPIFAVTNAIRDFGTAYKLSEVNNLAVFAAQYVKALGGIITNNADYKRYKAMGGGHSSELSANIDNIARTLRTVAHKDMGKARRLAYSLFVHPVETVAMFNDAIESVPRFAEFQRTLKDGGDLQEAIFNASDITTNFKRSGGGVGVKIANSTFMFNNAAIQGIDKTFRTLTNKDTKKRYRTLLKWLLHALLMGIIGYIYNKEVDEEGYKNLSSYKKNNFYNFAIGDGKFISLPKPRENALLDTFTERAIEYAFGNENAFYDFSTYLGGQLIPPMIPDDLKSIEDAAHSWLGGTVLGGIVDVGFNQDFKDTPIESAYDIYTPSNERYTESTTKFAYTLGQTKLARNMDMSPKKIDHLLSSYTGILGQINKALFPMNEERKDTSIGLRNKFISDSNYSTDVLNRMYENQEKAEKAFQYSGTIDTAIEYEKNSIITSYISGMNKAVKALPKDEQRSGRAYLLKALNSWNYDDSTSQLSMLSSLDGSTVSKDVIFNELPSSSLEWTVDKQKYVYQMTPQEYHKYISDYLTVIENARRHYGGSTVESYEAAKEAAKKYMSDYKKNVLKRKYITKATAKTE